MSLLLLKMTQKITLQLRNDLVGIILMYTSMDLVRNHQCKSLLCKEGIRELTKSARNSTLNSPLLSLLIIISTELFFETWKSAHPLVVRYLFCAPSPLICFTYMYCPPLISRLAPVINPDSGDAKKVTAFAIS